MACPIIMALINRIYHKLISCIPFCCLYRRDPFTLSALTASNKDCSNISNIGDNSDWLLTSGKSFNEEDKDSNNSSLLDLGTTSVGNCNWFKKDHNLNSS